MVSHGRLRANQLQLINQFTPAAMVANAANTVFVTTISKDFANPALLTGWVVYILLFALYSVYIWTRRPPFTVSSQRAIRHAVISACLLAVGWSFLPLHIYPKAPLDVQLVIAAVITGMIGAGSFALASLPQAVVGYCVVLGGASLYTLYSTESRYFFELAGLMASYALMCIYGSLAFSRSLLETCRVESHAGHLHEEVLNLIRDFDMHSNAFVWEIDRNYYLRKPSMLPLSITRRAHLSISNQRISTALKPALQQHPSARSMWQDIRHCIATGTAFKERPLIFMDTYSKSYWVVSGHPLYNKLGVVDGWRGIALEDTHTEAILQKSHSSMMDVDAATGLLNRSAFIRCMSNTLGSAADKTSYRFSLIIISNFKAMCGASHSGEAVNSMLAELASRLNMIFGVDIPIGKLWDHEIGVLENLPSSYSTQDLLATLSLPYQAPHLAIQPNILIGQCAIPPDDDQHIDAIFKVARAHAHAHIS